MSPSERPGRDHAAGGNYENERDLAPAGTFVSERAERISE